jgi:hypothetical protein
MKSREDFLKIISRKYWDHIHKETNIPEKKLDKDTFCNKLYNKILNRHYSPSNPKGYVISNKHNLVIRVVPSLSIDDYCVYYYCIKSMEDTLAVNRVDGTFGGYRMGGAIAGQENTEFLEMCEIPFSVSQYSYNPIAWVSAWRDFQKKACVYAETGKYKYFIKFDIANFYDAIDLSFLERKVRNAVDSSMSDELDLLFFFLRYWDRKFMNFAHKVVGIPQDEVGDCSRILSNFYLQDYDAKVKDFCDEQGAQYLRYADDQLIMAKNRSSAEAILFFASKHLKSLNLNINSAKVEIFDSREKYDKYWSFDIFDLLGDKEDKENIEKAIQLYMTRDKKTFKHNSVLRRLMNCSLDKIDISLKSKIFAEIYEDDFLSNCDARMLVRLFGFLKTRDERQQFLTKLDDLSKKVLFNQFHYNLLSCKRMKMPIKNIENIKKRIIELSL